MALEIRELIVRATLGGDEEGAQGNASADNQQDPQQTLIQTCVEAVLEILRQRNER